ncbi:alpha/beta fold hydrolase [Marinoscillum sp. MHG1-6]|uniref:alpha/beta fold hydrolase n=1 Tax=Marinoscillum sp. MHG1-6 TaxID=2959627 RepID=UPI0021581EDD|nr:alpha/beta fold hydrolase [Marinoscillum sp. MHG1-6]
MKLNFRTLGEGKPLIILHGLFGSADNWQTLAKGFAGNYQVYLVDQRNHGASPHSNEFNYDLMVQDLKELFDDENIGQASILGHSMGGKTAMCFAAQYPELVDRLIVVDIGPKQYPPHHENIFNAYRSLDLSKITSRKEAEEELSKVIHEVGVRLFILKNLGRNGDNGFEWKINLDGLEANASEVGRALDASDKFDGPTLFIGGANSHYIKDEDSDTILSHFPEASIQKIDGAGHWVHADKPKELYEMVSGFLS